MTAKEERLSSAASPTPVWERGQLVVKAQDPRGLARIDRVLTEDTEEKDVARWVRVFFFATGVFEVVAVSELALAPDGTGAPAHPDSLDR